MSGHSKWSTIKRKKGVIDSKRSKIFTKIIKEISVAAKIGGGIIENNSRLRSAVAWAKSENMPMDNVTRAIKKGTGEMENVVFEEIVYEGYGPSGIAAIVETLTDNKNRTVTSIRSIFNKSGGKMGSKNSVLFTFDRTGVIRVLKSSVDEDILVSDAIDAGSSDIEIDQEDYYVIYTDPADLHIVEDYLKRKNILSESTQINLMPKNTVIIDNQANAASVIKFIDALEDDDDVQNVYTNFEISEELAQIFET